MADAAVAHPMRDLRAELAVLAGLLRAAGVRVGSGQVTAFAEAAAALAPADLSDLYWAGRLTLVVDPADLPIYDQVFAAFWGDAALDTGADDRPPDEAADAAVPPPSDGDDRRGGTRASGGIETSDLELLRHRRFDTLDDEELAILRTLMGRIPLELPRRTTRRTRPARRPGRPDLRRTLQQAIRTDGELLVRAHRRRRRRARRLVLLLDVSGSMAGYSRALLQFAYAARTSVADLEVFCFGTRLTRITEQLDRRDPDTALAAAADEVLDWEGGTRIATSLGTLLRDRRSVERIRGAVVVICSDGLERGDPDDLARQMARLARLAHRVVWVNPLKAGRGYAPVQRGMQAALPHVDRLIAGHDLASLERLADVLAERR